MIYICDNGLIDVGSHSFNLVVAILRGFAEMGERAEVLAYRGVADDVRERLNVRPHFTRHLYEGEAADSVSWEVDSWLSLNASFFADLRAIESEIAKPGHTLLFPGLTQHQLLGLARWITSLPERRRPKIVVQLMFYPSWTVWGATTQLGPLFYKNAADLLRPLVGKSVFLGCENEDMAKLYRDLTGLQVDVLPIPTLPLSSQLVRQPGKTLNLVFLGYSKAEKGFHLLPEAVRLAREVGLPARFIIQAHHGGWEAETVAAESELRQHGDTVVLLKGAMPPEAYFRVFSMADVVLLPYDPEQYYSRGSGILSEAASYGKPVVATHGTWMEVAAARGECTAVILKSFDSAALFESICTAVANFSALSQDATIRAVAWHDTNNARNYCETVVGFGNFGVRSAKDRPQIDKPIDEPSSTRSREYRLGDVVYFGKTLGWQDHVSGDRIRGSGDDVLVGSSGVELVADLDAPSGDLELALELASMMTRRDRQEIAVSLNGHWVATISGAAVRAGRAVVRLPSGLFPGSRTFRLSLRPLWSESAGAGKPSLSPIIRSFQLRSVGDDDGAERPKLACNMAVAPSLAVISPLEFEAGWSHKEAWGRWAIGPSAVLVFTPSLPLDFSAEGYSLVLDVMIPANKPAQTVTVRVNDLVVSVVEVSSTERISCPLPRNALMNRVPARVALETSLTYAVDDDPRPLRLLLSSVMVTAPGCEDHFDGPVPCYRVGERLEFGRGGSATPFLRAGWSRQEVDHCWIAGTEADLIFTVDAAVQAPLLSGQLSIPPEEDSLDFEIWVNGEPMGHFVPTSGKRFQFSLPLPASAFSAGERTFIRFKASHTVQVPGDARDLSICMHNLMIEEHHPIRKRSAFAVLGKVGSSL